MTRVRLRPKYPDEELAQIYQKPHDHKRWADHLLRVRVTTELAYWMINQFNYNSVADLSCGDGDIAKSLNLPFTFLGDFAPGYDFIGPIEKTINEIPKVDMFICSETIEHLDDPDAVLGQIAVKSKCLILSTPIGENDSNNPEHYWGWGVDDVKDMLHTSGWEVVTSIELKLRPTWTYDYQIHGCRRNE